MLFRSFVSQSRYYWWWLLDGGNYSYENKIENRTLIGDPGKLNKLKGEQRLEDQLSKGDELNRLPGSLTGGTSSDYNDLTHRYDKDLVTFRIQVISNEYPNEIGSDMILYFRASLDSITDTYNADWDPVQYVGRGDKLYHYKGFDRQISLGWTVAAQSREELLPMYERLNRLANVCAPNYSAYGYMRGVKEI